MTFLTESAPSLRTDTKVSMVNTQLSLLNNDTNLSKSWFLKSYYKAYKAYKAFSLPFYLDTAYLRKERTHCMPCTSCTNVSFPSPISREALRNFEMPCMPCTVWRMCG